MTAALTTTIVGTPFLFDTVEDPVTIQIDNLTVRSRGKVLFY